MTPERVRVRVRVTGRVQGVCFRASAVDEAERLGVSGFARNLPDGSVEIEAEGERRLVEAMVEWCRQGPRWARVEQATVEWLVAKGDGGAFHIAS
jgi:acylphosphatase